MIDILEVEEYTIDSIEELMRNLNGWSAILIGQISDKSKVVIFEDYLSKIITEPITIEELNDFIWKNRDDIAHFLGFIDAYEMVENESGLFSSTGNINQGYINRFEEALLDE